MQRWSKVAVAAFPVAVLAVFLIVFLRRWCSSKGDRTGITDTAETRPRSLQSAIAKLHLANDRDSRRHFPNFHHHHHHDLDSKRRTNYYVFRRGVLAKPLFSWADHPWLVTEAVEHGWSRFAFTANLSSPSTKSSLLGLCAVGDQGRERDVDISWEVFPGSADFMQKIRLNPGLKKINTGTTPSMGVSCVVRSALPLPGPPLGTCSFPQEAYFEITILYSPEEDKGSPSEGERSKLIQETADVNAPSDSLVHVAGSNRNTAIRNKEDEAKSGEVMLSVGLTTGGGSLPSKLPGSYPGSIGFNSNGSVHLDGIKLVFEAGEAEWGMRDRVIGCGFDPGKKKVFFTVDSELVHLIHCKSEEFSSPLYPTLAANMEVTVLVNFGQSAFKYAPANPQRTPNPCFIGPLANAPAAALGYEDSRELFSMGRIDSDWFNRSTTKNSNNNGDSVAGDVYEESETDLFEIVLR
ncbi:PREDICTED: uncharacterized protein LOC104601722 [Nelumbo nucifera]|uniref:Uncharacterized protein LOC104601722 n=1 Tax=Nelumbo nucifera TaxID=4432 RepID=A0A1U8A9R4_NELNU|nr:PREDICTED: uncharacterized protein LOC104601722 [Nelumbo nucifera]